MHKNKFYYDDPSTNFKSEILLQLFFFPEPTVSSMLLFLKTGVVFVHLLISLAFLQIFCLTSVHIDMFKGR